MFLIVSKTLVHHVRKKEGQSQSPFSVWDEEREKACDGGPLSPLAIQGFM